MQDTGYILGKENRSFFRNKIRSGEIGTSFARTLSIMREAYEPHGATEEEIQDIATALTLEIGKLIEEEVRCCNQSVIVISACEVAQEQYSITTLCKVCGGVHTYSASTKDHRTEQRFLN